MGRRKARERATSPSGLPPFSLPITPCSRRARYAKTTGDESALEGVFMSRRPYENFSGQTGCLRFGEP